MLRFEYHDYDSKLWIRLDDGTVIEIEGYGYEECSLQHRVLTWAEQKKQEHERQGLREYYRNLRRNVLREYYRGVTLSEVDAVLKMTFLPEIQKMMNRQVYLSPMQDDELEISDFRGERLDEPDEKSV